MLRYLLFASFVGLAIAAVSMNQQTIKEGETPHCMAENGDRKELGEEWPQTGQCAVNKCLYNTGNLVTIITYGCGVVHGPESCKVVENLNLPYPDCCPKLECSNSNNNL